MDEGRVGDAYVAGHVDIEGDMLRPFEVRRGMGDRHYAVTVWRFLQPLLFGQVPDEPEGNIGSLRHRFASSSWPSSTATIRCTRKASTNGPDETLSAATVRKFDYCFEKLGLKPGDRILEIGPGWGAWFTYASQRGVKCTGLTISKESKRLSRAPRGRAGT